jgi:uncharacterized protein YegP (UPF0339 family)
MENMTTQENQGFLYEFYRNRVGEPTTHDEVRGYWVFLTGLVLGTVGILLFIPSAAPRATSFTLREASIFVAAVGLLMMVAGPVIRLPLQPWANYAAYAGQAIGFVAAVWFLLVFPNDWVVTTGNQPVIVLYALGLAVITVGGAIVPLLAESDDDIAAREAAEADREAETAELRSETEDLRAERDRLRDERDRLADDLDEARTAADAAETARTELEGQLDAVYDSQARFELYEDKSEEWRWRLRHRNGNLIATSGEGYTRKHNAQKGLASVRGNAPGAATLLLETEPDLPEPEAPFEAVAESESDATIERYEDSAGEWRWRLRHDNGEILGDGSEGYASKGNVDRAIDRVREYVGPADYLWFDPTGFEVYQDNAGEWRWRLVHRNGNILADSGEGYTRRNDANRAVERIRTGIDDLEFETYEDAGGEYRWRLRGSNDRIVADSGEGYGSESGVEDAVERVRSYAPDADVLAIGRATFEIYEDKGGEHRWRLRHRNGNILMDSGEGYASRSGARDGIESVKRNAPNADIEAE